ncbi:MAG: hypothetical protein Q8R24_04295 [Legionellaceae bacterium]|nr:hypothetical protein [Legionellaceae bacterium]
MPKILRNPLFLGSLFFSMQLFLILFICPEKNLLQAWLSLASHWDSEWYEAIAKFGYINIDGPLHSGLQNANVVFFPGYPYLVRACILLFGIDAKIALLLVSQTATLCFWCLFFYILRHIKWHEQFYAALLVMTFPTSWFMFTGYSESLFMLMCCLMLWLAMEKRWLLSGISGVFMTSTRIIGIPVLIAPLLSIIAIKSSEFSPFIRSNLRTLSPPTVTAIFGSLGCLGFLTLCAIQFGSWHLYFDMERINWKGTADPLFLFKLPTWVPPPFGYNIDLAPPLPNAYEPLFSLKCFKLAAYTFSETLVPIFLWISILFSIAMFKRTHRHDTRSLTWYFGAVLLFLFTCFSLSTRHYESMSRCLYPVWILLIISDVIHPEKVFLFRLSRFKLNSAIIAIVFISFGFWLQLLNRFLLGWWVA